MSERFNASKDRSCPWCWRRGSLVLSLDGSGLLECGGGEPLRSFRAIDGCGVRFRVEGADLVRVREPQLRRLTNAELAAIVGGA
jgi:hypothetical protein